jgi:hypothetical protein
MAVACLERLSDAHPRASDTLANMHVPFGPRGSALLPRAVLCILMFAQNRALLENRATASCISTALRLLMNLTYNRACGDAVARCGGAEALATALLRTGASRHGPPPSAVACSGSGTPSGVEQRVPVVGKRSTKVAVRWVPHLGGRPANEEYWACGLPGTCVHSLIAMSRADEVPCHCCMQAGLCLYALMGASMLHPSVSHQGVTCCSTLKSF